MGVVTPTLEEIMKLYPVIHKCIVACQTDMDFLDFTYGLYLCHTTGHSLLHCMSIPEGGCSSRNGILNGTLKMQPPNFLFTNYEQ